MSPTHSPGRCRLCGDETSQVFVHAGQQGIRVHVDCPGCGSYLAEPGYRLPPLQAPLLGRAREALKRDWRDGQLDILVSEEWIRTLDG